jgi:glycosyltransferase involved in cell wall biosynthesis
MRIGVDACCWFNKRGFGRFTRELLKSLATIDNENDYFFFADRDTVSANGFPDGVKIVAASTKISPIKAASAHGRRSFKDLWAMSRKVLRYNLDLFFFPAVYSYFPIINRAKIIVTIHDMTPERFPKEIFPNRRHMYFWKLKQHLAIRQADLILTVSEYAKQEILRFFNMTESQIAVISEGPNHIFKPLSDKTEMANRLHRYQLHSLKRYLLYVGGISPHKNLKALVRAYFELTKDSLFTDVKLVLAGDYRHDSFYSDYSNLLELINRLQLGEKIIFTGYIGDKDLSVLYNGASILVFPSLQEGFGLPAVEAMACGTPVAASKAGSLPEILGEAGRFFNPRNPDDILRVLKNILFDHEIREEMSRCGLRRAKLFSWEKAAKDLLLIFNDVMKN